jgi:predicted amidophosphoribosyltransferase
MARSVELPAGEPLGFPRCVPCPYRRMGPARICVACASKTLEAIEPGACPVCSQILGTDGTCPNWLCDDPRRRIEHIDAIAYLSGALRDRIHRYKYYGRPGWSLIFGRLLVGWLEAHVADDPPDLIVANPTFIGRGGPATGHIERIIESAAIEDAEERWAFDVENPEPAIIKTGDTEKSAGRTAAAKRGSAAKLRRLLEIPNPSVTEGSKILVFDDVCTTGSQLNAVADCLLEEGHAAEVRGLVLARAPWRSR